MKKILLPFIFLFLFATGAFCQTINDPFFEHVNYRGAFGATDWTAGWAQWDPQNANYPASTFIVTGDITSNTTWNASTVYELQGFVYVKPGATLTIEPGTVIRGDKTTKGTLIIEKGARINAQGSMSSPIVFTSNADAGSRDYGDWGGIILCGKATINVPGDSAMIEGGPTSYYGGGASPDDADSSGILKYVRIEFPGVPLQPNQEINGLTLGAVGSKTTIEYVQISYSGDDSFEFFGGKVNVKHLIAFRGWDDDFDTDYGYSGMLQFLVSLRDPDIADQSGSNGFESDNDASGSTNSPQTKAVFSNVSLFGPKVLSSTTVNSNYKRAMHIRRNSSISIYNSVISAFPVGLYIDGTLSQLNAINNSLKIEYSVMAGMGTFFSTPAGSTDLTVATERVWYMEESRSNDTLAENTQLLITDPFNLSAPNFIPTAGSEMLHGSIWDAAGIDYTAPHSIQAITYPDPASDYVNLQFAIEESANLMIGIYDITGREIKYSEGKYVAGTHELSIDLKGCNEGVSFLKISDFRNSSVFKLIIQ